MKLKYLLTLGLSILLFASCNNTDTTPSDGMIRVSANIGNPSTRATAVKEEFKNGDEIGIYAWTGTATTFTTMVINGITNTFDGTKWTPASPMRWADLNSPHYFVATYPTQTITDLTDYKFTLTGNQADDDLLFATNTDGIKEAGNESVGLNFTHSQAKLLVNLSFRKEFVGTPTVSKVTVLVKSVATVNFVEKTTAVLESATQSHVAIIEEEYNKKYETILVPQVIKEIKLVVNSKDYTYTNTAGIELKQGIVHTLNLAVGRDLVTLVGNMAITAWDHEGVTNGNVVIN